MNTSYWARKLTKDKKPDSRKRYNSLIPISQCEWIEGSEDNIEQIENHIEKLKKKYEK